MACLLPREYDFGRVQGQKTWKLLAQLLYVISNIHQILPTISAMQSLDVDETGGVLVVSVDTDVMRNLQTLPPFFFPCHMCHKCHNKD